MYSILYFITNARPPTSTLFPYTTLFRSKAFPPPKTGRPDSSPPPPVPIPTLCGRGVPPVVISPSSAARASWARSEEHTSELQSRLHLVCRLLLEKKKSQSLISPPISPLH